MNIYLCADGNLEAGFSYGVALGAPKIDQNLVENGQQFYPAQRGIIKLKRPDLSPEQQAESGNMVAGSGFCLIAGRDRLQAFPLVQSQADEN